jgi:NADPH:quinone reductase-like Zn-dependent oxidoreductase
MRSAPRRAAGLPTAARGEVRVRVLASGLEYTDVVTLRGSLMDGVPAVLLPGRKAYLGDA